MDTINVKDAAMATGQSTGFGITFDLHEAALAMGKAMEHNKQVNAEAIAHLDERINALKVKIKNVEELVWAGQTKTMRREDAVRRFGKNLATKYGFKKTYLKADGHIAFGNIKKDIQAGKVTNVEELQERLNSYAKEFNAGQAEAASGYEWTAEEQEAAQKYNLLVAQVNPLIAQRKRLIEG